MAVVAVGDDQGHEGAVLNVQAVTGDVDGVLPGLRGPVAHVARAVVPVLALDLGLGRSLDGKTWRRNRLGSNQFNPTGEGCERVLIQRHCPLFKDIFNCESRLKEKAGGLHSDTKWRLSGAKKKKKPKNFIT